MADQRKRMTEQKERVGCSRRALTIDYSCFSLLLIAADVGWVREGARVWIMGLLCRVFVWVLRERLENTPRSLLGEVGTR